jgi:hypothetical protein
MSGKKKLNLNKKSDSPNVLANPKAMLRGIPR